MLWHIKHKDDLLDILVFLEGPDCISLGLPILVRRVDNADACFVISHHSLVTGLKD